MKKGPELLDSFEDHWETDIGAWFPGERVVYRGRDLLRECRHYSWLKLVALALLGKELDEKALELWNTAWVLCASYPEPRLWNNRVAALAGTTRSTAALGITSANAVSEAKTYGRRADIRAITFLYTLREAVERGEDLGEIVDLQLKKDRSIPGFGRPVTSKDERIDPLLERARELGFGSGPYLNLVYSIQDHLDRNRKRFKMNVAVITAALFADIGFSPRQYYIGTVLCFSAGMIPCYMDTCSKEEGAFFPLGTDRINYTGEPCRVWG